MADIHRNVIIDDEQIKHLNEIDGGNHHIWQVYYKNNPESKKCDFKLSCIDRDRLQFEIDSMKTTMPDCKQIGSVQYVSVNEWEMEKYESPLVEGFSNTFDTTNRYRDK